MNCDFVITACRSKGQTIDVVENFLFISLKYFRPAPVHYTVIRAIGEQMGVGGDDSWGANVHPEYIPDVTKPVEFTFTFRGI